MIDDNNDWHTVPEHDITVRYDNVDLLLRCMRSVFVAIVCSESEQGRKQDEIQSQIWEGVGVMKRSCEFP